MPLSSVEERRIETRLEDLKNPNVSIAEWFKQSFEDEQYRTLLTKMILQILPNAEDLKQNWDEVKFLNDEREAVQVIHSVLNRVLKTAKSGVDAQVVTSKVPKTYTTGELAVYFGVSQTTINKWINQGLFEGVKNPGENKHKKVTEDTWFNSPSGVKFQVKDAVAAWEQEQQEWNAREKMSEDELYQRYLEHFENKYGGRFEDTLGKKGIEQRTAEEDTDASMWAFFLERKSNVAARD